MAFGGTDKIYVYAFRLIKNFMGVCNHTSCGGSGSEIDHVLGSE